MIREAEHYDAEALADIYNYYVLNTIITFEESLLTGSDVIKRIGKVQAAGHPWLVALESGDLIGYAYATKWNERAAYKHTAEVTVYVANAAVSRGWGTQLYEALFSDLRKKAIHTAIGGIALPNPASVALHEKFGMDKVAHFKEVGYKFGEWLDVGYWQVQLRGE